MNTWGVISLPFLRTWRCMVAVISGHGAHGWRPLFFFPRTHMMPLVMVCGVMCAWFFAFCALCGCAGPPLSGAHLLLVLLLVRAALLIGVGGRG